MHFSGDIVSRNRDSDDLRVKIDMPPTIDRVSVSMAYLLNSLLHCCRNRIVEEDGQPDQMPPFIMTSTIKPTYLYSPLSGYVVILGSL